MQYFVTKARATPPTTVETTPTTMSAVIESSSESSSAEKGREKAKNHKGSVSPKKLLMGREVLDASNG